jgi:hypothetical protein
MLFAFWWGVDTKVLSCIVHEFMWASYLVLLGLFICVLTMLITILTVLANSKNVHDDAHFGFPFCGCMLQSSWASLFFHIWTEWNKTQKIIQLPVPASPHNRVIHKVTLSLWASFHPPLSPLSVVSIPKGKKDLVINLSVRSWYSPFNAQGSRVIIVVVQSTSSENIYVAAAV